MAMKLVDTTQLESDLTSVADSIRAKTGGADALAFPSGFVSAVEGIESADSALAEVEHKLSYGYRYYDNMFHSNERLQQVPTEIIRHTSKGHSFKLMFYYCSMLQKVDSFDVSKGTDFSSMFAYCSGLDYVGMFNTENGEKFVRMFYRCNDLIEVAGINISKATEVDDMFYECRNLESLTFNGVIKITGLDLSYCSKLTHDSLMSAINALYDWASEGSTSTYTLTLGSTNLAKLTDTEKAIATQRGWTLA